MEFVATVVDIENLEEDRYEIVFEDSYFFAHGPYHFKTTCNTAEKVKEIESLTIGDKIIITFLLRQEKMMYEHGKPFDIHTMDIIDWKKFNDES